MIQAITVSMFGPVVMQREKMILKGLWYAYVEARSLAVDLEYSYPNKEIGLEWRVCKPHEKNA